MSDGTTESVLVRDDGPVRVVTLNRPDRRNALAVEVRIALAEIIEAANADTAVRAVVVTGAGGCFCAGGDLTAMERMPPERSRPRIESAQRIIRAVSGMSTPVVAAVEGVAFGAGLALAIACDRVVASADARFGGAFTGVGLAADAGVLWSLPRRVGVARARQILMMGEVLDAATALDAGLVDVVVPPGDVATRAMVDARRLADGPPRALALLKQAFANPAADLGQTLDAEVAIQAELMDTDDYAEGIAAFGQKRRPVFGRA